MTDSAANGIDQDLVVHLGKLARLELTDVEVEHYTLQLEQILGAEKPALSAPVSAQALVFSTPSPAAAAPVIKVEADNFKGLEKNQQLKNLVDLVHILCINDLIRVGEIYYILKNFPT
jgi:hypothetical protein